MTRRPLVTGAADSYQVDEPTISTVQVACDAVVVLVLILLSVDRNHWTSRYYRDRELAHGLRWTVSRDPELAAEQLSAHLGGFERARRWVEEVLVHLERSKGAA